MKRFLLCFGLVALCAAGVAGQAEVKTTHQILTEGAADAPIVEVGDTVTVHATGTVSFSGAMGTFDNQFWSTKDVGQQPFTYTEGGEVITGWDKGAQGMKLGEKRTVNIPADVAADTAGHPFWLLNGGYGMEGFPADGVAGIEEFYESFDDFQHAATSQGPSWATSDVEGAAPHGACMKWTAFAPGRQGGKIGKGASEKTVGSTVTRWLRGSGTAVLELEDCYGVKTEGLGALAGTGTQVFYNDEKVGPTIKDQKYTYKIKFTDWGQLQITEVHSIWKVHSFKIYRDLKFELEVLDTFVYLGSMPGVKSNPDLVQV